MSDNLESSQEPLNNARSDLTNLGLSLSLLNPPMINNHSFTSPINTTNNFVDSLVSLSASPRRSTQLPQSLKIATWNCCGLSSKSHQVDELFEISQADILILNETFRQPGTPWPSVLPPLLAEATSSGDSRTRQPAGVAVLANPLALRQGGKIRSCETIGVDNENGTKVVVKVNNLIVKIGAERRQRLGTRT